MGLHLYVKSSETSERSPLNLAVGRVLMNNDDGFPSSWEMLIAWN